MPFLRPVEAVTDFPLDPENNPPVTQEPQWHPDTIGVHGGVQRSGFDETAEALYLTSGYVYNRAEDAEAAFKGDLQRYVYSRYGNPTVDMFQQRLAQIEGAEQCYATASGMSAVFTALISLLKAGDRLVASRALFGSCYYICNEILPRYGVTTVFVDGTDLEEWRAALNEPTDVVFLETPTNPGLGLTDLAALTELAHAAGAQVVIDNVFATPLLQRPVELGADVIVYSATKHIDGQGRCLGGAILGTKEYCKEKLEPFIRHTGPSMSPFNAWVLLKGLETLSLRVDRQCGSALAIATWLEKDPRVTAVSYPFLASHPQHELARRQMDQGGTVVTFEIGGGRRAAFDLLNRLGLIKISNNLGDAKSLITHPASTTHSRLTEEERAAVGISEGMIRLSVGLEHQRDLVADLDQALGVMG